LEFDLIWYKKENYQVSVPRVKNDEKIIFIRINFCGQNILGCVKIWQKII